MRILTSPTHFRKRSVVRIVVFSLIIIFQIYVRKKPKHWDLGLFKLILLKQQTARIVD